MDFFNHDSYSRALLSYYEDEGFAEVSPTIFLFIHDFFFYFLVKYLVLQSLWTLTLAIKVPSVV